MKHTTKTVADQLKKQHSNVKSVVKNSNREAYISDCKYVDWFELGFDLDYFEED